MGIYLPNMEMPKNCEACELAKHFDGYQENDCPFNAFSYYDCPLIPVPPHGRLIDADVFTYKIKEEVNKCTTTGCKADRYLIPGYIATMKFVNDLPTLISASEEGSV